MSYAELLNGLLHKDERVVQYNQFQHLPFSHVIMGDVSNTTLAQRPAGICLLTDKRLLLLSSQVTQCKYSYFKSLEINKSNTWHLYCFSLHFPCVLPILGVCFKTALVHR